MVNPLFYERIVPLDSAAHRHLKVGPLPQPYAFARDANLIPALIEEFSAAATYMPIAFLPGADKPAAVFVTGFKPGENLFVKPDGKWTTGYLPAYLRRYPFIMGDVPEGQPILCIDDSFQGLGDGSALFAESGEPSAFLTQALTLAENYRLGAQRSDAFCMKLQQLRLFRSVTLDARRPDGQSVVVHGLMVVDEDVLNQLPDSHLVELQQSGYLRPIYAHLLSLGALARLSEQMEAA
jgi:hypothetical protein